MDTLNSWVTLSGGRVLSLAIMPALDYHGWLQMKCTWLCMIVQGWQRSEAQDPAPDKVATEYNVSLEYPWFTRPFLFVRGWGLGTRLIWVFIKGATHMKCYGESVQFSILWEHLMTAWATFIITLPPLPPFLPPHSQCFGTECSCRCRFHANSIWDQDRPVNGSNTLQQWWQLHCTFLFAVLTFWP